MAAATESVPRNHLVNGPEDSMGARTIPIITPTIQMSAPSPGEPMEITTPTNSTAPPSATKSPDSDVNISININGLSERAQQQQQQQQQHHGEHPDSIMMPAPVAAAAAVHQPKIVQTAFIHKLYKYATPPSAPCHAPAAIDADGAAVCWKTSPYST
jgi:hypothetical protein